MKNDKSLSISDQSKQQDFNSQSHIWLQLSAFLSTRSPNTQKTYLGILKEWALFLGAEPGSPQAAQKIITATDMHVHAYRQWLQNRPGETPRMLRKSQAYKQD